MSFSVRASHSGMRTPRWFEQAFAMSTGLFKLAGLVSLMAAMVALELIVRERHKPVTP